uniref:ZP domain-containing protein n=1 Tax=Steinernema glaseri TaxID=37863 RepID=A0A1I7ZKM4_9BILA
MELFCLGFFVFVALPTVITPVPILVIDEEDGQLIVRSPRGYSVEVNSNSRGAITFEGKGNITNGNENGVVSVVNQRIVVNVECREPTYRRQRVGRAAKETFSRPKDPSGTPKTGPKTEWFPSPEEQRRGNRRVLQHRRIL